MKRKIKLTNERKRELRSLKSSERRILIKQKLNRLGLTEGSGIKGRLYDSNEIQDLIKITSCFPELRN